MTLSVWKTNRKLHQLSPQIVFFCAIGRFEDAFQVVQEESMRYVMGKALNSVPFPTFWDAFCVVSIFGWIFDLRKMEIWILTRDFDDHYK